MSPISDHHSEPQEEQERQARNTNALVRFALLFGVALVIASSAPPAFFAATFSSFLFVFSLGSAIAAGLARDAIFASVLTRWDQAAALMAVSILAKFFVDPAITLQEAAGAL